MTDKGIEEIGQALAEGYPSKDIESTRKDLARVVEVALPALARRVSFALGQGNKAVEEVWKAIRDNSEEVFAPALNHTERVKVIYVASKFANNKMIGELMTGLVMEQARMREEK